MSPKGDFLTQQQKVLDDLEENLVEQLDAVGRQKAIEQGQLLEKMQSAKDEEETIACLPTLRLSDIAPTLPEHSTLVPSPLAIRQLPRRSIDMTN